jgi:undecaprenyl-phosphate galactose phosphotransferase/putative colanic acid biosynthesis UDP-glucose lipid carrier transferase
MLGFVIVAADLLSILCAGQLTNFAYHAFVLNVSHEIGRGLGYGIGVAGVFVLVAMNASEYTLARIASPSGKRLAWHWMVSLSLFLAAVFVLKVGDVFSRGAFLIFAITGAATLIVNRHLISLALNKGFVRGLLQPQRCALVGEPTEIDRARRQLEKSSSDIAITESIEISRECGSKAFSGAMNRVMSLSREHAIDSIVIALPWSRSAEITSALALLRQQALPVILLPDVQASQFISEPLISFSEMPAYVIKREALSQTEQVNKRILDIIVASTALVVLSPIFALAAIMVKLDSPGPALFRQRRSGFNSRDFEILKFRTMRTMEDEASVLQASRNDPRITRVGAFLRRSSIDELPQLINVLRGEMSIVGPRPHAVSHNAAWAELVEDYALRHHIKPGITGLAQVNGFRGRCDTCELIKMRVHFDLEYINRWSIWLDLKIIAKTICVFFFQRTAF